MASTGGMLQIGELAKLTGVTTRTIRHYHRTSLLPEPARTANGYRTYGAQALSRLVQIRRLTSLGLTLSEVADALDAEAGRDMQEVLTELDAELAAEEARIQQRRAVIARLLEHGDDPTLSPELAEAIREMGLRTDEVDALRAAELVLPEVVEPYRHGIAPDPATREFGLRLGELAGVGADDPRVEEVARELYALLPGMLPVEGPPADVPPPAAFLEFGNMLLADLSDGQCRAMELLIEFDRAATQDRHE